MAVISWWVVVRASCVVSLEGRGNWRAGRADRGVGWWGLLGELLLVAGNVGSGARGLSVAEEGARSECVVVPLGVPGLAREGFVEEA